MQKSELELKNILIVDDDVVSSKALAKRLDRRGFNTCVVTDQSKVFETIIKEKIDLILLDIIMPDMDGISLLKEIRLKYSKLELPVIMATIVSENFDIVTAFQSGANDYITKPINIEVADARIAAHLMTAEFQKEKIEKKELEAVHAMAITYNHEINNPLAIAMANLDTLIRNSKDLDKSSLSKIESSLKRIEEIVVKIKKVGDEKKLSYETYALSSKMIKIK